MSWLNWSDPETHWLIVTNVVLGLVVALCVAVMAVGAIYEVAARWRKRRRIEAEIDRDMQIFIDDHAFHAPGLGVTMADGGEKHKK